MESKEENVITSAKENESQKHRRTLPKTQVSFIFHEFVEISRSAK
jgi:hypothetical protein